MILTFTRYRIVRDGIEIYFTDAENTYMVFLTDAELNTANSQIALRNLLTTKLERQINRVGIASKLDAFIGQNITV